MNDGYFGSGKYLLRAIDKYSPANFLTEIIAVYNFEWQMNLAEKILVVLDSEISYNLCKGGQGGFSYLNAHPKKSEWSKDGAIKINSSGFNGAKARGISSRTLKIGIFNPAYVDKRSEWSKRSKGTLGQKFTKKKTGCSSGSKNSQFGKFWITNGAESKKIKDCAIPQGWRKGRICKKFA